VSREINGQTRWSPEPFGTDPTKTVCPSCKGTGLDWNNSNVRDCEECDGYGEVNK
jgi:DnaJ-class molecular chaperone